MQNNRSELDDAMTLIKEELLIDMSQSIIPSKEEPIDTSDTM
ncbi:MULTISPECIES: hypothetical protein [Prochlorococcus]|nr:MULTISPECIES: hypothetical protein [Prochlorococcus]KGG11695.1 hypothetical protein EV04_0719 [Prochlorococcus marinus str. LG]KGG18893.1 hypothetical protein EV08_1380 [Prochlorococcus marinus str. SS2]KGG23569.1 hypothetical protein EV09_1193 [Prochlorococcus marinus str. SS35]KGG32195.1 hypothetical protein EV10_1310 [Prochlorococcus marinus str. SS51]KGG35113.1 hypothetical protein EV11_1515 [Prochlorococcus sp. SS52]